MRVKNLAEEVKDFNFDAVCAAARNDWEQALSSITVEGGGTDDLKKISILPFIMLWLFLM